MNNVFVSVLLFFGPADVSGWKVLAFSPPVSEENVSVCDEKRFSNYLLSEKNYAEFDNIWLS